MGPGWRDGLLAAALALGAGGAAQAQQTPAERAREAAAMISAAGFRIQGAQIVNGCGRPSQPRPAAVDMNGDGRPEAIITDADPACYGPAGQQFWVIQKRGPFNWALVGGGAGRIKLLETRTNGWRDYSLEGPGCQRTWTYQGAQGYLSLKACPGEGGPPRPAVAASPPPPPAGGDRVAALRAGASPRRGASTSPATRARR